MLVAGLAALAGIAVTWLRRRRAGGEPAAAAGRDLAVALALAASWAAVWGLYATYAWTAAAGLSTLQAARFYVPALGAISLLGAWLLTRVPRGQPLAAITTLAVAGRCSGWVAGPSTTCTSSRSASSSSWCTGRAARSSSSQAQGPGSAGLASSRPAAPAASGRPVDRAQRQLVLAAEGRHAWCQRAPPVLASVPAGHRCR